MNAREHKRPVVAIVGAGAAGTLVACELLRTAESPMDVELFDSSGEFGPGVAYATRDDQHLMNVPAGRLSTVPQQPEHFLEFARNVDPSISATSFVPRKLYGDYLRAQLDEARAGATAACLHKRAARVSAIRTSGAGSQATWKLDIHGEHEPLLADAVVLATGFPGAVRVAGIDVTDPAVFESPWQPGALDAVAGGDHVVVIGSGLTAIDATLSVCAASDDVRVTMVSRSGRLPYPHLPSRTPDELRPLPEPFSVTAPSDLDSILAAFRAHVEAAQATGFDWRDAIDALRPNTPTIWQALSLEDRRRFVQRWYREWELRRHRMAPAIHAQLDQLRAAGRWHMFHGEATAIHRQHRRLSVNVASASGEASTLAATRAIVCAGPQSSVRDSADALLKQLVSDGIVVPDDLDLGLRTDGAGALVNVEGLMQPLLRTLGPLRRGELWETTAMREIAEQSIETARRLTDTLQHEPDAEPTRIHPGWILPQAAHT